MGSRGLVVGIAQVVNGVDQGFAVPAECGDGLLQGGRVLGIEAEVNVEHIERARVRVDPAGVQHDRRPPLARCRIVRGIRIRVREAENLGQPRKVSLHRTKVVDVDVSCGDTGDPNAVLRRQSGTPFSVVAVSLGEGAAVRVV